MALMVFMPQFSSGKASVLRLLLVAGLLLFGSAVPATAATTRLAAQGTIEVLFTPWDDAEGAIVRAMAEARQSIHVQAYLITSRPIAAALIAAAARGVKVKVLADREMAVKGANSRLPDLVRGGVSVWLETQYAAAHNKVILIDAADDEDTQFSPPLVPLIITGSYNYTWSAQARNAENLLLLRGNAPLAKRYLGNWRRHLSEAQAWNEEDAK